MRRAYDVELEAAVRTLMLPGTSLTTPSHEFHRRHSVCRSISMEAFMTMAMCSAVAAPIATIFAANDDLALRALDGLTPQQMWEAPTNRDNAMLWLAGHLVQTRTQL